MLNCYWRHISKQALVIFIDEYPVAIRILFSFIVYEYLVEYIGNKYSGVHIKNVIVYVNYFTYLYHT